MRRLRSWMVVLVALGALTAPGTAFAASPEQVIADCTDDGVISDPGRYGAGLLRETLRDLPADTAEYNACNDVINVALSKLRGGGGGSGSGGGGSAGGAAAGVPSGEDTAALNDFLGDASRAAASGEPARGSQLTPGLQVGNERIMPGVGKPFALASLLNDLPLPVLLALVSLAALGAAGAGMVLRRRGLELRRLFLGSG